MNDTTSTTGFLGRRLQRVTRSVGLVLATATAVAATALGLASPGAAASTPYTYSIASVPQSPPFPFGIAIDEANHEAHAANFIGDNGQVGSTVSVFDTHTNALGSPIAVGSGPALGVVSAVRDGTRAAVGGCED